MVYKYDFDGSTEDMRSGFLATSVEHERIDTIEIIINGESVFMNHSAPNNNIKVFNFRVGTHGLGMVGDDLIKG